MATLLMLILDYRIVIACYHIVFYHIALYGGLSCFLSYLIVSYGMAFLIVDFLIVVYCIVVFPIIFLILVFCLFY